VRSRAALRCEYCRLSEEDAFFAFEPDHIIATKHGGPTDASNLALACFDCNRFKGSDIASLDPETGVLTPLFNPRSDAWSAHLRIEDGTIVPTTAIGRVTVAILRINLPARVEVRRELASRSRWPAQTGD
jgi:HNH endonuclease